MSGGALVDLVLERLALQHHVVLPLGVDARLREGRGRRAPRPRSGRTFHGLSSSVIVHRALGVDARLREGGVGVR